MIRNGPLPRAKWPPELDHPEVRGVFIGGCVERGVGSRMRAEAHAHTAGSQRGWICILSAKRLACRELLLHERAHVVTRQGHGPRWRAYLLQIGGTLDAVPGIMRSYHPKPRAKAPPPVYPYRTAE
jgi:hypothetical protein